jgi:purine catabolism regulator
VTLTVRDIVEIPGMPLRLLTGEAHAERAIRWVHASELEDPTPWLKGGELILTTGMGIGATAAKHRAYVRRLSEAGVGGLGFGLGFGYDTTPKALVAEATKHDFPLFEVPYPVPFIAITEAVFTRLLAEQYDTLQRAVDAEHVLTRAVLDGKGIDGVVTSLGEVIKGWAILLDLHGLPLAATGRAATLRQERIWDELRSSRPDGPNFSISLVDRGHHVWLQPVGAAGRIEAFLAVGKPEQPTQLDRIVAGHALSLFAIELAKSRAVADAQRKLQGDFFDELVGGIGAADAARGLARFGFERDATFVVVALEAIDPGAVDPQELALATTDHLSRAWCRPTQGASPYSCPRTARTWASSRRCSGHAWTRSCERVPAHRLPRPRWGGPSGRRGTRSRSAGSRAGPTRASRIWGPIDSCSAWPIPTPCARSPTRCSPRSTPMTAHTTAS